MLQFHSVWMLETWEIQKWQLRNNNLEVNIVNKDHINFHTAIYSCLTMLIFFINEVNFACGFIGNNIKRSQHITKYNVLCMFLCVCACVRAWLRAFYKFINFHERSIRNVADLIQRIRLCYRKKSLLGKFYVSVDGAKLL